MEDCKISLCTDAFIRGEIGTVRYQYLVMKYSEPWYSWMRLKFSFYYLLEWGQIQMYKLFCKRR